ncbi:hypothetical protein Poly51_50780 [Rubripirellula tenax]|uniref:Uncharacterized protein n=1 Tax=Rubripirellula tenax TaxID=2528015 RepID=A0A5C6EJ48_9BACT|nr:hypothetical protein [Rubripirellula tenax]TWU47279.1 hypothetical protein Poly51_50780 [Rubripirellula tenax]
MNQMTSSGDSDVKIDELIDQFYRSPAQHSDLGSFEKLDQVPRPYDGLLDHNSHMTVTVEAHWKQPVDVVVHRCSQEENWYSREITLVGSQSKQVVQFGIVRLDTSALNEKVWRQIESQQTPLGRVLIEHHVLREVQLCGLWKVHAGQSLASLMKCEVGDVLYGRTALIHCDGVPAIELLEIVAQT